MFLEDTDVDSGTVKLDVVPPWPDYILLDLSLSKFAEREVLPNVKQGPDLRCIPVVVWTTSKAKEDVLKSYDLHTNAYITKPMDMDGLIQTVKML